MVIRSRTKLLEHLGDHPELKAEWLNSGVTFETIWACGDFMEWCCFPEKPNTFPVDDMILRQVISKYLNINICRTAIKIAASFNNIQVRKTGNPYVLQFPDPQSHDARCAIQDYINSESEVA
jgi:hypothetical protein